MLPFFLTSSYLSFWLASRATRASVLTQHVSCIQDIDYEALRKEQVRLLIFDYDDTLTGHREPLSLETIQLLKKLATNAAHGEPFQIAILSNRSGSENQVSPFLDDTALFFQISQYRKPQPEAFFPIFEEHNILPRQAALIGDRAGTDMWGAYRLHMKERILVTPYSDRTGEHRPPFLFRWLRSTENARCSHSCVNSKSSGRRKRPSSLCFCSRI